MSTNNDSIRKTAYLNIGDKAGRSEIIDEDRLSYRVRYGAAGKTSIRTFSKDILQEFIDYCKRHPDAKSSCLTALRHLPVSSGCSCMSLPFGYTVP